MKYLIILFLFATTCLAQTLHLECDIQDLPDAKGNPRTSCSGNLQAQRLTSIDKGSLSFEWSGRALYVRYTGDDRHRMPSRQQDSFSEVRDEHGNPVPWSKVRTLCVIAGPLEGKTGTGGGLFACGQVPPRLDQTGRNRQLSQMRQRGDTKSVGQRSSWTA